MNLLDKLPNKLSLVMHTFAFLRKHVLVLLSLGLIAAFGRVIQLRGFGQITSQADLLLEVIIEFVRILIFVYALGFASLKKGALRIKQLFTDRSNRILCWSVALQKMRKQWGEIIANFFVFFGVVWMINYLIDLLAYQTCLYLTLKKGDILSQHSSEWTIILFFKNISVIPLTLTFEALVLLWMINKLRSRSVATAF